MGGGEASQKGTVCSDLGPNRVCPYSRLSVGYAEQDWGGGGGGLFLQPRRDTMNPNDKGCRSYFCTVAAGFCAAFTTETRPGYAGRGGWRDRIRLPSLFAASPRRSAQAGSSACLPGEPSTCPELPAPLPPPARPLCTGTSPPLGARNIPLLVLPRACHVLFTPTEDARRQKSIFFFFLRQRCFIFLEGLCFL